MAITTQDDTNCVLDSSGRAICWGYAFPTPLVVDGPLGAASAGWNQACFLAGSEISCTPAAFDAMWSRHPDVPPGDYLDVASGLAISCGLRVDGVVDCWGWDESVQGPERSPATAGPFARVRVGAECLCAIDGSGAPTCWVPIPDPGRPVRLPEGTYRDAVCMSFRATCGVSTAAEVACAPGYCTVDPMSGVELCHDQVGVDLDGNPVRWAEAIGTAPSGPFTEIALSFSLFMCGLRPTGEIVCWGRDYEMIRPLEPDGVAFVDLGVGTNHVCGVTARGEVACWGVTPEGDWGQTRAPVLP